MLQNSDDDDESDSSNVSLKTVAQGAPDYVTYI